MMWRSIVTAGAIATAGLLLWTLIFEPATATESYLGFLAIASILPVWALLVFRGHGNPFEPLNLLLLLFVWGVIWKVTYLVHNPVALNRSLNGKPADILIDGFWLIVAAVAAFAIGYSIVARGKPPVDQAPAAEWRLNLTAVLCLLMLAISLIAAALCVASIGIENIVSGFSQRRFDPASPSAHLGTALYAYYKIALLARIPFYVALVYLLSGNKWRRPMFVAIAALSFLIAVSIPVMFNTRANAMLIVVDMVAIAFLSSAKLKLRYILPVCGIAGAAFLYMTMARAKHIFTNIFDSVMGQPYFLELTKTSHILHWFTDFPLRLHGETLIGWLFIPVPQSWFDGDKPFFLQMGKLIGSNVYGYNGTGVPAGFIGELFINFGWTGVIVGMFVAGLVMAGVWNIHQRQPRNVFISTAVAMIVVRFGVFLFNNDLGTFVLKNAMETLPTLIVLAVAAYPIRRLPLLNRYLSPPQHTQV